MIDTEHVKCDTCTAPEPMELDASDEASRGWPTVDIETNPYKAQFPLFQQHPEIAFLDSAATAQRPACVLDAERDFYQRMNANPLRGLYSLSVEATEAIAKVRQQIADVIGAPHANEVVFTRNTSESLNLVAKSFAPTVLEPGDEVVITIMEHHSNLIPWQQVCRETGAKLVYLYPTKTGSSRPRRFCPRWAPRPRSWPWVRSPTCWASRTRSRISASSCTSTAAIWSSTARSRCRTCRSMWPTRRRLLCL